MQIHYVTGTALLIRLAILQLSVRGHSPPGADPGFWEGGGGGGGGHS